jgi:hypothetical protein
MTQEQVNQMIREAVERGRQKEALRRRYMQMAAAIRAGQAEADSKADAHRYWVMRGDPRRRFDNERSR